MLVPRLFSFITVLGPLISEETGFDYGAVIAYGLFCRLAPPTRLQTDRSLSETHGLHSGKLNPHSRRARGRDLSSRRARIPLPDLTTRRLLALILLLNLHLDFLSDNNTRKSWHYVLRYLSTNSTC